MKWQIVSLLIGLGTFITACGVSTPTPMSIDQLITVLQTPESPDFVRVVTTLKEMGPNAAPASQILGKALQYPRRDSYIAALALIEIGPAAKEAIPELVKALKNERADVRADAAIVLGVIGEASRCAAPDLALLLDDIPEVRGSAARALDAITGRDLVKYYYKLSESTGVIYDEDGSISKKARSWWIDEGQHMDWTQEDDWCHMTD